MGNFLLGFKALFRAWGDAEFANYVRRGFESPTLAPPAPVAPPPPAAPAPPARNDAITLLSVLQREARFIDFLKESITEYSDAEVGAAVRGLHKDANATIERLFAIEPLSPLAEGAPAEAPAGFDPAEFRLIGNVPWQAPFKGKLSHPGWKATRCELPGWAGGADAALVVAPIEIEF